MPFTGRLLGAACGTITELEGGCEGVIGGGAKLPGAVAGNWGAVNCCSMTVCRTALPLTGC